MKRLIINILIIVGICWAQDTNNFVWTKKNSMPTGHHSGTLVACSGSLYHIGGQKKYGNRWSISDEVYKYDINSNEWSQIKNMPTKRMNLAGAVVDGKIYVIGGDQFLDKNEMYDPGTDSWASIKAMPTPRQHVKAATIGNKIYVLGGLESWTKVSSKNEVYDTKTNTWETKKSMPIGKHNYSIAVYDGKIYVFGGGVKDGTSIWGKNNSVEMYDPDKDTWETVCTMIFPRFNAGIGVVDDKIIIIAGSTGYNTSRRVDIFNPKTKEWSLGSSLTNRTIAMGSACCDGKIYIVGGSGGGGSNWNCYTEVFEGYFEQHTNVEEIIEVPDGFELDQNYPNPFNPSTTIRFELPKPSKVKIDLFNSNGEKVKELLDNQYDQGSHFVKFNFTDLPSGVYYYKMLSANFQETRKMILVK